ncbi:MAG: alcohol dehydrogenase catalytic domain-containing protein [Gaiellales bacterium]
MRAVVFTGPGGPEVVELQERPDPVPGPGEVVVAATHAGLNPADLIQRAGHYPAPPGSPADIPGLEAAGTVAVVGERVTSWKAGDRVFGLVGGGGLADRVLVHERHLAPVPDNVDDPGAAAVPEAFITAHDAVFTRGRLTLGERLLVNGANGGVGSAAVQLGIAAGVRVFAGVRSPEAAAAVADLGAEPVEPGRPPEPADVVLELVGAPLIDADLDALAPLGRIVVVGTGAGADAQVSLRKMMGRRAELHATMLRARPLEAKAAAVQAFTRSVVPLLARGTVRPQVDSVFDAGDANAAFERLAGRGKLGKVLLRFG